MIFAGVISPALPRKLTIGTDLTLPRSIGPLIDMLGYARRTTHQAIEGLTAAQLDHRHDAQSNSIGALLLHIAAVELWYQTQTFERREWTAEEEEQWLEWIELRANITGRPLEFYLDTLASIRARTESELRARDDEWMLRIEPFGENDANNYWKWFHVCEDEINHRGQIRWLRKRLPA
jgi:uncharacterized damage-inducible protein DinB